MAQKKLIQHEYDKFVTPASSNNSQSAVIVANPDGTDIGNLAFTTQLDYVSGTNPIYIGTVSAGTATSSPTWQIKKLTYDGNSNVTQIQYAGGTNQFNQIWDNRASLTYS